MIRSIQEFANKPWRNPDLTFSKEALAVPTMLSMQEQKLYYWLAHTWAQGIGDIVELGSFIGGSTARLGEGARSAGKAPRIHAFDRFTCSEALKQRMLYPAGVPVFEGDDMLHTAHKLLSPWGDIINVQPGMIEDQTWSGDPIEILIIDAAKHTTISDYIAETFFPALVPGQSLVVHQDYMHWKQPWLAVQMELLSEYFEPVAYCDPDTVVFLNTKQLPENFLDGARLDALGDEAFLNTLRAARKTLDPLDIAAPFKKLIEATKLNPGVRNAHMMA